MTRNVSVACNLCGANDTRYYARSPEGQTVVQCRRCDLIYTNPRVRTDAAAGSVEAAQEELEKDYGAEQALYHARFADRLRWILSRRPPPAAVLDVGCAWGYFLDEGTKRGYEMYGVELSPQTAAFAQRVCPRVHVGTLETAPWPECSFDIVTLWHTLEHLPDPLAVLQRLHRLMKPGAQLFIEVPDAGSRIARAEKERWVHFRPSSHLYYFDRTTVRALLTRAGFTCSQMQGVRQGTGWGDLLQRLGLQRVTHGLLERLPRLVTAVRSQVMQLQQRGETDVLILSATRSR